VWWLALVGALACAAQRPSRARPSSHGAAVPSSSPGAALGAAAPAPRAAVATHEFTLVDEVDPHDAESPGIVRPV
jgi:hypothetical protein